MHLPLVLGLLALIAYAESDVIEATPETLDSIIKEQKIALVEFYAPWCGHCKKLAPEWEAAATELKGQVALVKIDVSNDEAVAKQFQIQGFPTIIIFQNGEKYGLYEGERTKAAIVAYAKELTLPAIRSISSTEELEAAKQQYPVIVVFHAAEEIAQDAPFAQAAEKYRFKVPFFHAKGLESEGITLYKNFDEGKVTLAIDGTTDDLVNAIATERVKLVDELGPTNYREYIEIGNPIVWLFTKVSDDADKSREILKELAVPFKGKLSLTWIDADKYSSIAEKLGLTGTKFPSLVIDKRGDRYIFPEDKEISTEDLRTFFTDYLDGKIEKSLRSEPVPVPEEVNGLTTIVGTTFDDLVVNSKVDLFIEFYAPWCGHCKNLAPIYEAVAKTFESNSNIRIAKFDATANDFNQTLFFIQGFPTMYFVPAKTHVPIQYDGERTEDAITAFITKNIQGDNAEKKDEL